MYEHKKQRPLTKKAFARRLLGHAAISFGLVGAALSVGVLGYHFLAGFAWIDALLDASMILGGMGPVKPLLTPEAKLFASFYALFSGLVFIGLAGFLLAPFVHRMMHKLHWEEER